MNKAHLYRTIAASTLMMVLTGGLAPTWGAGAVTTRSKPLKRPPYYQGRVAVAPAGLVHRTPSVVAPEGTPAAWLPLDALTRLALEIDQFLTAESLSSPVDLPAGPGGRLLAPSVYFGCVSDLIGECDPEVKQNALSTSGGTSAWRERIGETLRASGAEHGLLVELRLAPQWIHQKNISGKKEVRLGTDHAQKLPWLTSLESPVWVLQLTGALIDREGRVLRSGAEGIMAVRVPFRGSILGVERLMKDDEVDFVRREFCREDLPGCPLAWQEAVRQLLRGLSTPSETA